MKKLTVSFSLMALALAACTAKVDGGSGPTPTTLHFGSGSRSTATVLEGTWNTGCVGSSGLFVSGTVTFTGNTDSSTMTLFSDSACTQAVNQQTQSGTFSIGAPAAVAGANNIDYASNNGTATYDIFKTDGTILYFGSDAGSTPQTRSTTLNTSLPFTKAK